MDRYEMKLDELKEEFGEEAVEIVLKNVEIIKERSEVPFSCDSTRTMSFVAIHNFSTTINGASYKIKNIQIKLADILQCVTTLVLEGNTKNDWLKELRLISEFVGAVFSKIRVPFSETDCQIILALYFHKIGIINASYPCNEEEFIKRLESDKYLGKMIYNIDGIPREDAAKSIRYLIDHKTVEVEDGKLLLAEKVKIDHHY